MIDKPNLYGRFEEGEQDERRSNEEERKLAMKVAHKALDVRQNGEPVQINTSSGISTIGLLGTVGLSAAAIVAAAFFLRSPATPVVPSAPTSAAPSYKWKIDFSLDPDGKIKLSDPVEMPKP